MIVVVPADIPETTPALTVAIDGSAEVQVPPGVASAIVIVLPSHTEVGPVTGLTVAAFTLVIVVVA